MQLEMLRVIIIILTTKQLLEKVAQNNVGKRCAKQRWKKLRKKLNRCFALLFQK
jgi:hypothetical protein